ncbi:hypothetical protein ACMFMF_009721 [Clarireedia jacksonii]
MSMYAQKRVDFNGFLWKLPYPSSTPSMHTEDIDALHAIQNESFYSASFCHVHQSSESLLCIKVYPLFGTSYGLGITGMGFASTQGEERLWGSAHNAASLAFFLGDNEKLVSIRVDKPDSGILDSRVHHLQSSSRLHCFGVLPATTVVSSSSPFIMATRFFFQTPFEYQSYTRGGYLTSISPKKRYQSVQVSIDPSTSLYYSRAGQVTGLLFRSANDLGHPDVLGQWTGADPTYVFEENEEITGFETILRENVGSQCVPIAGITMVTSCRQIKWGGKVAGENILELSPISQYNGKSKIETVFWEFNADFVRIFVKFCSDD